MPISQITPITAGTVRRTKSCANPFDKHLGINTENLISEQGTCAVTVVPQEITSNIQSSVHGGWIAALLDTVASGAAYSYQAGGLEDNEYGLTASLNIRFIRPVLIGETYTCEGAVVGREGNSIQTKAVINNKEGTPVATAIAVVKARQADYKDDASLIC